MSLSTGRVLFFSGILLLALTILSVRNLVPWLHWGPHMMEPHVTASEAIYFLLGIILIVLSELDWT